MIFLQLRFFFLKGNKEGVHNKCEMGYSRKVKWQFSPKQGVRFDVLILK